VRLPAQCDKCDKTPRKAACHYGGDYREHLALVAGDAGDAENKGERRAQQ
jgi:hypothetical protein